MESFQPFDWKRIFLGSQFEQSWLFILEVVFRVMVMYIFAILLLRFMGKRGKRRLSPLEYIIIISLGSATGDSMFYPNVPLFHGMTVVALIIILEKLLAFLKKRFKPLNQMLTSNPAVLIKQGRILKKQIKKENLSKEELFTSLREQGIMNLGEVELAILEISGSISVFKAKSRRRGKNILPKTVKEV